MVALRGRALDDAEGDLLGCAGISLQHLRLNVHGKGHGVHSAGELHEHTVARRLEDPALEVRDGGIDKLAAVCLQGLQGADLISPMSRE